MQNIEKSNKNKIGNINKFCDEWIAMFSNENTTAYQLIDNDTFPDYCRSFGWIVDNGKSFQEKYNCNSYDDVLNFLPQVSDVDLLGTVIFSHWRYFNHWAYSSQEILRYRKWFVRTLTRLKEIVNKN